MAVTGLAVPVVFGENDRFHPPVVEARDEAAAQRRGLFALEVVCTLPGQGAALAAGSPEIGLQALSPDDRGRLASQLRGVREDAERRADALHEAAAAARVAEEECRERQAEEQRARAQEERREQERKDRAAAQRRAGERTDDQRTDSDRADSERANRDAGPSAGGGGSAGYTGQRCYAPGGKTWRPC